MIENMSWMLRGSPHRDGSFEHQKQVLKLKLMDGIVSPVCLVGGRLSYRYLQMKKNFMNAYWGRLLGDGCFEHPGQMLKWMVLRVSPILYTLFDQCEFKV